MRRLALLLALAQIVVLFIVPVSAASVPTDVTPTTISSTAVDIYPGRTVGTGSDPDTAYVRVTVSEKAFYRVMIEATPSTDGSPDIKLQMCDSNLEVTTTVASMGGGKS